jgi:hypothetical protein
MTSLTARKRSRKTAKRKPTNRKPTKPVAMAKRGIKKEKLQWRDVLLEISYEHDYMGSAPIAHLQIQVLSPKGAIIPVTETGYRSHFISNVYVEGAGGPVAYVREWLDSEAATPAWQRKEQASLQLSLL